MSIREEIINELNAYIASEREHCGKDCISDLLFDEQTGTAYLYNYRPTGDEEQGTLEYEPESVEEYALDERLCRSRLCAPGYLWTEWSEW